MAAHLLSSQHTASHLPHRPETVIFNIDRTNIKGWDTRLAYPIDWTGDYVLRSS